MEPERNCVRSTGSVYVETVWKNWNALRRKQQQLLSEFSLERNRPTQNGGRSDLAN